MAISIATLGGGPSNRPTRSSAADRCSAGFERVGQLPVLVLGWPNLVQIRIVVKLLRETAIEEVRLAPNERNA
jgi:hypothetical protein